MFSLHETTRRHLCRWGFVALCLLPTCAVLGGAYWLHSDDYRRRHEAALAERFGLPVTLARVTHPTPTTTRYERVELLDPETRGLLARAEVALAEERGQLLTLQLTQAEISSVFVERLRQWTDDRLRGGAPGATRTVRIEPCDLLMHYPDKSQLRLVELAGQIDLAAAQSVAKLTCRLERSEAAEPLTMRMWRDRSVKPARSGFELATGGAVPCSMFAPLLPAIPRLGKHAQIDGSLWAVAAPGGWEGALEGPATITQVDLDALVTDQFPHKLSGTAQVVLQAARFSRDRLQQATGSLSAGPGFISYTLLDAAAAEGLALGVAKAKKPGHSLSFEELAIDFSIDSRGLSLEGQCHGVPAGTLLSMRYPDREQPVQVAASPAERQSVAALVRALSTRSDALLPASAEAQSLARLLPLEPAGDRTASKK